MRLFIGIPLAPALTGELSSLVNRLRSPGDRLRWSRPESWHITLQFLGETSREKCECAVAKLRELHMPPVAISIEELGCFDRAGIFFAGVRVTPDLLALQQRVVASTEPCGFAREDRPYQAHITLARGKDIGKSLHQVSPNLKSKARFTSFVAGEFLLYESFLGPGGSRYEVRERFPLKLE